MIAVKKWNKFMKPNNKSRYIYFKNLSEQILNINHFFKFSLDWEIQMFLFIFLIF